jgi:hypothetical protein
MSSDPNPDEHSVFINVPFDKGYERLFVALVATLVSLGRRPRCVLELPELGQGRLLRIIQHLEICRVSIHDLSRVGLPARFNMPFELGLAYALRNYKAPASPYHIILLEKEPHRLSKTLTDMAGHSPSIHRGRPLGIISCVLDTLGSRDNDPSSEEVYKLWRRLMKASRDLKRKEGRDTIFYRTSFKRLVGAATGLAAKAHFIGE